MHSRRTFLEILTGGAALGALSACGQQQMAAPGAQVALQLYSVRSSMAEDLQGTLGRVARMGLRRVETAFWPEHVSLGEAGRLLADTGLEVISAHVELPVGEHRDAMLEAADAYDCTRMVWHGWPEDERYATLEGVRILAEEYNESHAFASRNGLELYLHNHWWEFEEVEGQLPFYVLLEELDEGVLFELDVWWAKVAGQDPARVVSDFGARAPLLHIKDGKVLGTEGPMVAAGQGLQDFFAIAAAAAGHTAYLIIELDNCETDMFSAIEQSRTFLIENSLGAP
ncbi:MAG: sugar phosphate isomerase/epimerase [Bacteroidota bacterium]|nr:sugar phosphate isomerase/epimerase [Bacteroidota bacterium]MDE2957877.1 sugar phosphate isomerase/epimerase [Bacteroidota bacterium]